jgi:hypothetical protein
MRCAASRIHRSYARSTPQRSTPQPDWIRRLSVAFRYAYLRARDEPPNASRPLRSNSREAASRGPSCRPASTPKAGKRSAAPSGFSPPSIVISKPRVELPRQASQLTVTHPCPSRTRALSSGKKAAHRPERAAARKGKPRQTKEPDVTIAATTDVTLVLFLTSRQGGFVDAQSEAESSPRPLSPRGLMSSPRVVASDERVLFRRQWINSPRSEFSRNQSEVSAGMPDPFTRKLELFTRLSA